MQVQLKGWGSSRALLPGGESSWEGASPGDDSRAGRVGWGLCPRSRPALRCGETGVSFSRPPCPPAQPWSAGQFSAGDSRSLGPCSKVGTGEGCWRIRGGSLRPGCPGLVPHFLAGLWICRMHRGQLLSGRFLTFHQPAAVWFSASHLMAPRSPKGLLKPRFADAACSAAGAWVRDGSTREGARGAQQAPGRGAAA